MKAKSYFSRKSRGTPEKGALGKPSQWLEFVELELKGTNCLVADAAFMPEESEGVVVELAPGKYQVELKGLDFRGEKRVSLLKLSLPGSNPSRGRKLGETWTDTARTGICDHQTFHNAYSLNTEASDEKLQKQLDRDGELGVAVLDASVGAVMPWVGSGFGDGTYPVYELVDNGGRVGFEVEFVAENEPYPFTYSPPSPPGVNGGRLLTS